MCVCVREGEREGVCVCVCVRACVRGREGGRERVCEWPSVYGRVSVFVKVRLCVCVVVV